MQTLIRLLVRCGVKARGARIYRYPVRRSASSYPAARDGIARTEVRLQLPEGLSFVERVGFRYCVGQDAARQRRGGLLAHHRFHQPTAPVDGGSVGGAAPGALRISASGTLAASLPPSSRRSETPVFPHYSLFEGHDRFTRLPSCGQHAASSRCIVTAVAFPRRSSFFARNRCPPLVRTARVRGTLAYRSKRYCVDKDATSLPVFTLQVIDRRTAGRRPVFDIAVDDLHAFVAGTVCVHNCIGNSGPLKPEISAAVKAGDSSAARCFPAIAISTAACIRKCA